MTRKKPHTRTAKRRREALALAPIIDALAEYATLPKPRTLR